ncbi:uncharacterized protein LOC122436872 [Cervus canadensis]|uniref:uncharacterized protein LOC122436872 n=1 Tax=Cervus canadensis TaxID=1574408 RepID=UPI001C9E9DCC|nr:uncharacterized protein LOC122436872 [Cervus canadensis]
MHVRKSDVSSEWDQTSIPEPVPTDLLEVQVSQRASSPRSLRQARRGARLRGRRQAGPAAREVPGFSADFCVPRRLRHHSKGQPGWRGRGRGAAGSPGALTESASPGFPAAIDAASRVPQRRLGRPFPLALRPVAESQEARGGGLCPREGAAPTAKRGRDHPSSAVLTAPPRLAVPWGVEVVGGSWHCGSRPHFFPPPDARPTRPITQFLLWNCRVTRTQPKECFPGFPG